MKLDGAVYVIRALGPTDVVVSAEGTDTESLWNPAAASAENNWFDVEAFERVRAATVSSQLVDGVAPAIHGGRSQSRTIRRGRTSRASCFCQRRPRVDLAEIRSGGREVSLRDTRLHEGVRERGCGRGLGGGAGDRLLVIAGRRAEAFTVKAVVDFEGRHRGRRAAAPAPPRGSYWAGPARSSTCSSRTAAMRRPALAQRRDHPTTPPDARHARARGIP